jgi:hypothetical protein
MRSRTEASTPPRDGAILLWQGGGLSGVSYETRALILVEPVPSSATQRRPP